MRGRLTVAAIVIAALIAPSAAAQAASQDSVTGTATPAGGSNFHVLFTFDAHSGPSGENPTGTVTMNGSTFDVTCLSVSSNRASLVARARVVEPIHPLYGFVLSVEDNGPGSQDKMDGQFLFTSTIPTTCPAPATVSAPLDDGDITVVDAQPPNTYAQCRQAGWVGYGYASHAQCIDAVHDLARRKCIFERAAHGITAFRAKYGLGPSDAYAMRHCVRLYTGF